MYYTVPAAYTTNSNVLQAKEESKFVNNTATFAGGALYSFRSNNYVCKSKYIYHGILQTILPYTP